MGTLLSFGASGCSSEDGGETDETRSPAESEDDGDDPSEDTGDKADASTGPRRDASSGSTKTDSGPSSDEEDEPDASGGPDSGGGSASASSWCAAKKVIDSACIACHAAEPVAGAPMALETYDDLMADAPISQGKKVYETVKDRIHDSERPMPPSRMLTDEELAALDAWIDSGAEPGEDPTCAGDKGGEQPPADEVWPPPGCEQTYMIVAGENGKKASVAAGAETHPQFYLDAPWGDDQVQALGFRPITDNKKVLHHWIVYENKGAGAFLTGWAPGQDETKRRDLPENIGIYMPSGPEALRLDMHYFNVNGTQAEEDASGVEICVTRNPRPITATTFQGFVAWPYIAPGEEKDIVGTCQVELTEPVFLMSESPHAHQLATHAKLTVKRGHETFTLHDAPFRFEEQTSTSLDPAFELKQGDVVTTTCHYKNDTNQYVFFGESSTSEMCFNFATYYPMGALSCAGGLLPGL